MYLRKQIFASKNSSGSPIGGAVPVVPRVAGGRDGWPGGGQKRYRNTRGTASGGGPVLHRQEPVPAYSSARKCAGETLAKRQKN